MLSLSNNIDAHANVLLIEDNLVDAEWAQRALRGTRRQDSLLQIDVEHVDRLQLALRRLPDPEIDLIILDLGLPDVDDDLASVEKILALAPDVPIIVYSGSTYEQSGLAALDRGALYFFPKSSNDQRWFTNTVQRALERQQLQANLRHLIEVSVDGMAIFSQAGQLLFANPAALAMLEIDEAQVGQFQAPFSLEQGEIGQLKLGDKVTAELRLVAIEWNGNPAMLASMHDLTAHLRLERQLRQAQKMEAIGLLAGGLAHDLNNIITVVGGYANMIIEALPAGSPLLADLNEIQLAGERASTLIRRLLTFSKDNPGSPELISPDRVLMAAHSLLRRLIGEDIILSVSTGCADNRVLADPSELEQALVNLVINARDAMPDGGTLHLATRVLDLDESALQMIPGLSGTGTYVLVSVEDSGEGMDENVLNHIFEPFFTTKSTDRGTGLGLATTYAFVKQCGGSVHVYSEPGQGSLFRIYLPCENSTEKALITESAPEEVTGGTETILLVEDEAAVRRLAAQILGAKGYKVVEAADADTALQLVDQGDAAIDLLVTDIIMPGMNGKELAQLLQRRYPDLKTLFVSGYSLGSVSDRGIINQGAAFLQKPFSPFELNKIVRETIDH